MALVKGLSQSPLHRLAAYHAIPAALTMTAALLVYLLTLAPDLTLAHDGGDGGELITAAHTLGVPHPPGYPTYVLLGNLFGRLPLGSVAYRFNLLSAVTVAAAAGLVTAAVSGAPGDSKRPTWQAAAAPVAAGLAFAFAPLVWSQAVIAEVYGLNLAFLAAFLWALLGKRPPGFTALLLGLAVTTHPTSLFMLPLLLGFTLPHLWPRLGLGLLVGLVPLLAIPWLAESGSPVVWGRPETLPGWWWLISGRLYQPNVFALPPAEVWLRLQRWTLLLLRQYTWLGLPLIIAGLFLAPTGSSPGSMPRPAAVGLLATAALYTAYAVGYNTPDAAVLLLPLLLLLSLLLIPTLQRLGWLALLLPLASLLLNFSGQNLNRQPALRSQAEQLLQTAPSGAILLSPGDETIFALWYFHHVERQRPDVILVDSNLFAFDWYRQRLQQQYPDLTYLERDDLPGFIAHNQLRRPVRSVQLPDVEIRKELE